MRAATAALLMAAIVLLGAARPADDQEAAKIAAQKKTAETAWALLEIGDFAHLETGSFEAEIEFQLRQLLERLSQQLLIPSRGLRQSIVGNPLVSGCPQVATCIGARRKLASRTVIGNIPISG